MPWNRTAVVILFLFMLVASGPVACTGAPPAPPAAPVVVDGSSTVFPLSEVMVADFVKGHPDRAVTLTSSSTGVGMRRFCAGEVDIADASRPITADEAATCAAAGIAFIEMPVAYDAITVVVNRANTWASDMTVAELKALWAPAAAGKVTRWSQVRKGWPDQEIHLFGPDAESGTFDYFNEVISGGAKASRADYSAHVDDREIVAGVEADELALGYVGFTYYMQEAERLNAVAIDDLDQYIAPGAIAPTMTNIRRGVYRPFSRPLFLYLNTAKLERPEVKAFADFFSRFAADLIDRVGGIRLNQFEAELARHRLTKQLTGTMFGTPAEAELSLHMRLTQHDSQH